MIKNLVPVEYSAERVVTTEQLAEFYDCDQHNITKNFNENKEHFIEGKHYFKLEGEELKKLRFTFGDLQISPMTRSLYLWTKRGTARHAIMLGTDKVWDIFELLEENYFKKPVKISVLKPSENIDDFVKTHKICNWCGQVFETTDNNKRFCSENCEIRYKVEWDATYEERREAFLRDYENWQRIRPVYTIHNSW